MINLYKIRILQGAVAKFTHFEFLSFEIWRQFLVQMTHRFESIISNVALRGTRLAGGRRPEVNRSSELRILERSGNRVGRNEYIENQDFKNL